jgi:hypothetical protein
MDSDSDRMESLSDEYVLINLLRTASVKKLLTKSNSSKSFV